MNYDDKKLLYRAKNILTFNNKDRLLRIFITEKEYSAFLYMISVLLENEQLFLTAFPVAIDNILEVINRKRFEFKTTGDVRKGENKMIVALNQIKSIANEQYREKYRFIQESARMHSIPTDEDLAREVAYDIHVILALESNQEITLNKRNFLSSTVYLIKEFPELYTENPKNIQKTLDYIGILDKNEPTDIRKEAKVIRKCLKKYNKQAKGE